VPQIIRRALPLTYAPKAAAAGLMSQLIGSSELIHHPAKRWMLPVLHLDPAIKPAAAVRAIAVFRNQALQSPLAGGLK
jgi:hypothetical protein